MVLHIFFSCYLIHVAVCRNCLSHAAIVDIEQNFDHNVVRECYINIVCSILYSNVIVNYAIECLKHELIQFKHTLDYIR